MSETKVNTTELVTAIKHIAQDATAQAKSTSGIREKMVDVEAATRAIDERLSEQKRNTDSMENFANQLIEAVNVFQLDDKSDDSTDS